MSLKKGVGSGVGSEVGSGSISLRYGSVSASKCHGSPTLASNEGCAAFIKRTKREIERWNRKVFLDYLNVRTLDDTVSTFNSFVTTETGFKHKI